MGRLKDLYINRTREFLKRKAQEMIEKAKSEYDPTPRSGTQLDSYGALIFYNGGLVYTLAPTHKDLTRQSFGISAEQLEDDAKHEGWNGIPSGTGIEWGRMLRNEIKAGAWGEIPKKGFCLVIFNAAFYTAVLERGYINENRRLSKKYKVLSMVIGDMRKLESEFKGSKLTFHRLDG